MVNKSTIPSSCFEPAKNLFPVYQMIFSKHILVKQSPTATSADRRHNLSRLANSHL